MRIGKYRIRVHTINELDHERQRKEYWWYKRFFFYIYKTLGVADDERGIWEGHIEIPLRRLSALGGHWFSIRFHIGNLGSETPWDGHLVILGAGWYWGHSGFRNLAARLTSCPGYAYDSRDWSLRIFDEKLWWSIAEHSDMCDLHAPRFRKKRSGKRGRTRTWRRGSANLNPATWIFGRVQYTYETVDSFATLVQLEEDEYPVILELRKSFVGRTRRSKSHHKQGWELEVDAPTGIPTHVDHSGGWKGDRTYGWGIRLDDGLDTDLWKETAPDQVVKWVEDYRKRTGFVKPDPVERD